MKTEYLKKLHERALVIIELIQECNKRYDNARSYLQKWDNANWMDMIRFVTPNRNEPEAMVSKYKAIRQRLTKSYLHTMDKITAVYIDYVESKNKVSETY